MDQKSNRRAGRSALKHAGQDLHFIGFAALGGVPALPRLAAVEVFLNVCFTKRNARRDSVNHAANRRPVTFTKGRILKQCTETISTHKSCFNTEIAESTERF